MAKTAPKKSAVDSNEAFQSYCTMIISEAGMRWFAYDYDILCEGGSLTFRDIKDKRKIVLSKGFTTLEISKEEYEEYQDALGASSDQDQLPIDGSEWIDFMLGFDEDCEECT